MRIVIELKNDANPDVVQNQLYKHSRCQDTFGINNLSLVEGQPKTLGLKEILQLFIDHRKDVIRKRTEYDLKKAVAQAVRCALSKRREENRLHVVRGWEPSAPKTKDAAAVLSGFGVQRALVVDFPQNENLARSVNNLPEAKFLSVEELNLVDLLQFDDLFVSEQAAERLNEKYHTELSRKEKELREASNA